MSSYSEDEFMENEQFRTTATEVVSNVFPDDDPEIRENEKMYYKDWKEILVEVLAAKNMQPGDLNAYIRNITTVVQSLPGRDYWKQLENVQRLVDYCDGIEDSEIIYTAAQDWHTDPYELLRIANFVLASSKQQEYSETYEEKLALFKGVGSILSEVDTITYAPEDEGLIEIYKTRVILYMARRRQSLEDMQRTTDSLYNMFSVPSTRGQRFAMLNVMERYVRKHGFSEIDNVGFKYGLLPAMRRNDPQILVLNEMAQHGWESEDLWGTTTDARSIADFICSSYTFPVSPASITDLMISLREVPTTEYARLESNRADGEMLMGDFGTLKDLIHDQHPMVFQVVSAIDNYYKTGDFSEVEALVTAASPYLDNEFVIKQIRNLDLLDSASKQTNGERYIDIIRRVRKNTSPAIVEAPEIDDDELDALMSSALEVAEDSKEYRERVGKVCGYMYDRLSYWAKEGYLGPGPDYIKAIAWIDQRAFHALKQLPYEYQRVAFKEEWFHNVLRFNEMISSLDAHDPAEVESYIQQVGSAKSYEFGYQIVNKRLTERLHRISEVYKYHGEEDAAKKLWSGNTTDQLLGLIFPHDAHTSLGRKYRKEDLDNPRINQYVKPK